jgi:phosphatidylserine decarboxylase
MFRTISPRLFATPARFDPTVLLRQKRIRRRMYLLAGTSIAIATFDYKFQECLDVVDNPGGVLDPHRLFFARMFFGRLRSKFIGSIAEKEIPVSMRAPIYRTYANMTGVNLDEIRYPLDSFRTIQDFFSRPLKKGAREVKSTDPLALVSPADSQVMALGDIESDRIEQVKGTSYSLKGFLGVDVLKNKKNGSGGPGSSTWKYIVLYLCPGDYHRFHSPCEFSVDVGKHFSGEMLSVNGISLRFLNDVFTVNERVVLAGKWAQGEMHYAAVAAHGVGNIKLSFEKNLKTNDPRTVPFYLGGDVRTRKLDQKLTPGEEVGMFKLGSTIVLVFEASNNMQWNVKQGDLVKVGEPIISPRK